MEGEKRRNYSFYNSKVCLPRISEIKDSFGSSSRMSSYAKHDSSENVMDTKPLHKEEGIIESGTDSEKKRASNSSAKNNCKDAVITSQQIVEDKNLISQYQRFLESRHASSNNEPLDNNASSTDSATISSLSSSEDSSWDETENDDSESHYETPLIDGRNSEDSKSDIVSLSRNALDESSDTEVVSQQMLESNIYETINGTFQNNSNSVKKTSFKKIATLVTLMPRVTTESVKSRQNDRALADINQYLPDGILKLFVSTWNMKGTKVLPSNLESLLLPPESLYLPDVYVIGVQEGTPFRREWHILLQETFGPSHVLIHSCNFGVLQLVIFVRRELVWFCTNIEQDTTATRVGHKIKTKGALAVSFNLFGTSFLFITSHFTSNQGKIQERLDDYNAIRQNIQLPSGSSKDEKDVTEKFDRVFWFGDFNFRVRKSKSFVDNILNSKKKEKDMISKLLTYDELSTLFEKRKIFHGFKESPIHFMPTYKFDVDTDRYDTSSKQRVPSWTDRIVFKSQPADCCECTCYNSCNSIMVSDHRPVYGIFNVAINGFRNNFTFGDGQFDREVYMEANIRRNAPSGSQGSSNVCTIL